MAFASTKKPCLPAFSHHHEYNQYGRANLFSYDSATAELRQLTTTEGYRSAPALSPDGQHIAYHEQDADNQENGNLFMMDINGSKLLYIHSEEVLTLYFYDFAAGFASPYIDLIPTIILTADW